MASLVVRAREIITCDANAPQCGITFENLGRIRGAALVVEGDRITAIGRETEIAHLVPDDAREIDCSDSVVVPGFIDAHSHPLFAGDREPDFTARTRGENPSQGMLYTVERTREALSNDGFYARSVRPRLRAMLAHGTTTLETKTGYALTKEGEFALLDLIAAHSDDSDTPRLIATYLGAHALPPEFESPDAYVDYMIADCLPFARAHGAMYADAFCEPGYFDVQQTQRYLASARQHGLRLRVHCDEMADGGALAMAASLGVDAVDHANYAGEAGVAALVESSAVLVACPATIAFLGLARRAPVRAVLERGGSVALASDFNPGTSPCFNLQSVAYYGRNLFGLSAPEALYGVTRAPARSLRSEAGRLRIGELADFVALRIDDPREFGWQFGGNLAKTVVRSGVVASGMS